MSVWRVLMLVSGGLFTGGVMTFAWERVSAWRAMPTSQFKGDFARAIHGADRIQPFLLIVSILTALGFAVTATGAARALTLMGAAGFIVTLVASVAALVPLQRRIIASPEKELGDIESMKGRWFRGHLGRSALATISLILIAAGAAI